MLKKSKLHTRPTPAPRRAVPQARPRERRTGGGTDRTLWSRSPVKWVLANGKPPPVFPTSENLERYVEDLNEARTPLTDFFSILSKHTSFCPFYT